MQELDGRAECTPPRAPLWRGGAKFQDGEPPRWGEGAFYHEILDMDLPPRLRATAGRRPESGQRPAAEAGADPEGLAALLLAGRIGEARERFAARLAAGVAVETALIEDLGPAARRLGELWESDACDFVDVTHALHWLQTMMREMAPAGLERPAGKGPSILILLAPGETHEFGAEMVESFFRSAGWRVGRSSAGRLRAALARNGYDAVGFSLSCERFADPLARAIVQARAASRNPNVKILVGGAIFAGNPELTKKLGADFAAADADAALRLARSLSGGAEGRRAKAAGKEACRGAVAEE